MVSRADRLHNSAMQLASEQLTNQLRKGLAPIYLITGDEPLAAQESVDAVRAAAKTAGYERELHAVEPGFDWDALAAAARSLSLFATHRLIELRLPTGKPGEAGARMLSSYAQSPSPDVALLVVTGKLDKQTRTAKWIAALERAGVMVTTVPVDDARLPGWIERRMRARGLVPGPNAAELLARMTSGNLLACAQEIDKLALAHTGGAVTLDDIETAVSDNARYNVYALADACVAGDTRAIVRIAASLCAEDTPPALVLWALAREVRSLAQMAWANARGQPLAQVLETYKVWSRRKGPVTQALRRGSVDRWRRLLEQAAHVDRVIKGRAAGDEWHALERYALAIGGCDVVPVGVEA